jgi:CSLREA domain-containing protein
VVDNGWEPFAAYWWACNEPVTIEGKYHLTWSMEENGNRWHWRSHTNWIGSGVGEYSGSTYRLSETYNATENVAAGWTYPLTVSYTDRLRLVGQGATADLRGAWQWHVTVNANGETTAEVESWTFSCGDQGPPPFEGKLVVNVTDDLDDGSCDPTHCSLRDALIASNSYPGTDTIAFNIPGRGPHTIQPRWGLPEVFDPVVVDGTTEPNFAGTPIVELDGSQAGEVNGLLIFAGNSTVRGLVVNRFGSELGSANGIDLAWTSGNVVEGNYIGTDVTGTVPLGNSNAGVMIGGPDNRIGGTTAEARNVLSGNLEGVTIADPSATGNVVLGNYIGTDVTGFAALGNRTGVLLLAPGNTIGGTAPGARNVISANADNGITIGWEEVDASGNLVQGNYIGTDASGTGPLPNGMGILILGDENTIGGTEPNAGNVISGNDWVGIHIHGGGAQWNRLRGNYIGTDVTGTVAVGNLLRGVLIENGASNNIVGGSGAGARNLISGNGGGVAIENAYSNRVLGNYIGTDVTGTSDLGNGRSGVFIRFGGSDNRIGGSRPGAGNTVGFNGRAGIRVHFNAGTGNQILGNSVFASGKPDNSLGIDIGPGGVTPNDPGDADTGPNELQNFPVIVAAGGSSLTISGMLNSVPNTEFRVEFFANAECDPSGHGEGETFVGHTMVTTDGSGDASFTVTLPTTVPAGTFITATATDPGGNTSEFSACVQKI